MILKGNVMKLRLLAALAGLALVTLSAVPSFADYYGNSYGYSYGYSYHPHYSYSYGHGY